MECKRVDFSGHAVRRMFERSVSREEVLSVLASGEVIAEYPEDDPFPSYLMMAKVGGRALHVVVARDGMEGTCYVVTVYPPDPALWESDFRRRRSS